MKTNNYIATVKLPSGNIHQYHYEAANLTEATRYTMQDIRSDKSELISLSLDLPEQPSLMEYEVEFLSIDNKFFTRCYLAANMLEAVQFATAACVDSMAEIVSVNKLD